MNKKLKSVLAIVICLCIGFSVWATVAAAQTEPEETETISMEDYLASGGVLSMPEKARLINKLSNFLLNKVIFNAISAMVPHGSNIKRMSSFNLDEYAGFLEGNTEFLSPEDSGNRTWKLGYSEKSVVPDDFGEKKYARGSYVPWWYATELYKNDDGEDEDMRVRTVILDDGSGRGSVAFCVIDCIGLANTDVRKIRESVKYFAEQNNIISINVGTTHTHTGIDSQGVWTAPLSVMLNNFISATTGLTKLKSGVDETYLQKIIDSTGESIRDAYANKAEGMLTYAQKKITGYTHDRTPPYSFDDTLYRLTFRPFNENIKPTVIATFGCHPESASYDFLTTDGGLKIDTKISPDFVYYMEKVINRAGYNFIYIQGNVGTVTSSRGDSNDGLPGLSSHDGAIRFGYEMGYITLAMGMDINECRQLNTATGDLLGVEEYAGNEGYTVWYEDWNPVEVQEVEATLNIKMKQIMLEMENSVARILTKTGLANNLVIFDAKTGKYYDATEIGYVEIGSALKMFLCPGELFSEMLLGGDCLEDFAYPALRDLYGDNLIVCDLMNDAAGYISPDNIYTINGVQYDEKNNTLESDSWCMLVSMGKNTASSIIGSFIKLVESVR